MIHLSSNPMSSFLLFPIPYRIYSNGEIVQKMCSMSSLMTEYALHGRDFLAIHPGTHRSTPCILARDKAILINLNSIRSIVTDESMIIFNVLI